MGPEEMLPNDDRSVLLVASAPGLVDTIPENRKISPTDEHRPAIALVTRAKGGAANWRWLAALLFPALSLAPRSPQE
jgi:hypothetical protein